jgi:uncharacterized protein (DUF362 family)
LRYGEVILEQSKDPAVFAEVVKELRLKPPVIIKPNWGTINNYTEAEVIDHVLSAINGEAVVTESYGWARAEDAVKGLGPGSMRREALRRSDEWFLKTSGVGEVLKKHNAEYVNVTEEVWGKRTIDPETIEGLMKYPPVASKEFYARIPQRLYDLRKGTFLSLAKYRLNHDPICFSLTLKNFFGMIPGPGRAKYHGTNDDKLSRSIVDINAVYRSVFNVKGMVDGFYTASRGKTAEEAIKPEVARNKGVVLGSVNGVKLDAFVAAMEGRDPATVDYINLASTVFDGWEKRDIEAAQKCGVSIWKGR